MEFVWYMSESVPLQNERMSEAFSFQGWVGKLMINRAITEHPSIALIQSCNTKILKKSDCILQAYDFHY